MLIMTAREFNQRIGHAQRIADAEPVLVTRHGAPAYVLMNIGEYERLQRDGASDSRTFFERIAIPSVDDDLDDEFDRVMEEIAAGRARDTGRPDIEF